MCDDYDGDGKFDFAVMKWNPQKPFIYYVLNSTDESLTAFPWGRQYDTPAPQDYDGDGKTVLCLSRQRGNGIPAVPNNSYNRAFHGYLWNDTPLLGGDYDGDHKADLAFALWETPVRLLIKYSSNAQVVQYTYGHPWYTGVVSGDFDGDGKSDACFFDRYHNWIWIRSSDGQTDGAAWGQWNDVPWSGIIRAGKATGRISPV